MMSDILPHWVVVAESYGDIAAPLFPEEETRIARAVDKRRREFTTVRALARRCFGRMGLPPAPVLPGSRGAPRWPRGVLGSMTHCDGYRAATVARVTEAVAIGIDAEPNHPLPEDVLKAVAVHAEVRRLASLRARAPEVNWDRMLFSAKESVYKTWFPLTGRWLGFEDAEVDFDVETQRFRARLLVPLPEGPTRHVAFPEFVGRWAATEGFVATAIAVSAYEQHEATTSTKPTTDTGAEQEDFSIPLSNLSDDTG